MDRPVTVFVTDLDQTLFYPGTDDVPGAFFEQIRRWRRLGGTWVIATGRPVHRLHEFFEDWGTRPDYYIARERFMVQYVGSAFFPFKGWNRRMARLTKEVEQPPHEWLPPLKEYVEEQGIEVEFQRGHARFERIEDAVAAESRLSEWLPGDRVVIRNRVYLGVVPEAIGKGKCLNRLATARDWSRDSILTIGDSANDRDMLDGRYGFCPRAVNNAEDYIKELVREAGGRVMDGAGGDGVVDCLEQLLNDRHPQTNQRCRFN